MEILEMGKEDLLRLNPKDICRVLTTEEIVHIAKKLDAFWSYDYVVAKTLPGYHARLKSGRHSDGFFISKILLQNENILQIMAEQLAIHFHKRSLPKPDKIVGIPDGATELGKMVGKILNIPVVKMVKQNGKISLLTKMQNGESLLFVEDFCTRGTGFIEAVSDSLNQYPGIKILPYELVILNRGGLQEIEVPGIGYFTVAAAAEHRINDWEPDECPPCQQFGSKDIKPKESDENWRLITTAQIAV